jgi:ABC-2 type transport system permease protein
MKNTFIIFRKEFRAYFNSILAYIFLCISLGGVQAVYFLVLFRSNQADMRLFFALLPWMYVILVPALTMRLFSEERKLGTIEILLTLPVKTHEVVLGKYLAALALLAMTTVLSFPLPLTLEVLGNPDWGPIIGGYVGAVLMGAAIISVGIFFSALSRDESVAFILTFFVLLVLVFMEIIITFVPAWMSPVCRYLGFSLHFQNLGRGVLDTRDVIYYISVVVFFLYLNVLSIEGRKR